jgi:MFS family permease
LGDIPQNEPPVRGTSAVVEADAAYHKFVEDNLRRNYIGHFMHGMLGMTGFRLVNTPTFVPAYIHSISGSDVWVGVGTSLQQLGGIISPIVGASQIEHRKKILPVSVTLGLLMRLQILGLAISGWFMAGPPALVFVLLFLFLLGVFQGPQRVAFQLLLAKVIPIRLRGRLQAWRNLIGGVIAALLSYYAGAWLVADHVWGNGYATTFFVSFVLTSLGLTALQVMMREPEPPTVRERKRLRERIKDFPALIREDHGFAWFMVARTLVMGSRIAQPFFPLYAASVLGVSQALSPGEFGVMLAALSVAYMGADTITNLIWGYLSDRQGFRSTFLYSTALNILGVGGMLFCNSLETFAVAFFLVGAGQSGFQMSTTNIVLEYGHPHDVPMRMALSNTAEGAVGAVAPLLGAGLVLLWGYQSAIGATIATMAIALVVAIWKMDEPRRRAR